MVVWGSFRAQLSRSAPWAVHMVFCIFPRIIFIGNQGEVLPWHCLSARTGNWFCGLYTSLVYSAMLAFSGMEIKCWAVAQIGLNPKIIFGNNGFKFCHRRWRRIDFSLSSFDFIKKCLVAVWIFICSPWHSLSIMYAKKKG